MQIKRIVLVGLSVLILASTLAWLFFPTTVERSVGPFVWVERPTRAMAYPHPAIQLDVDGVFVSDFIDTRGGADMEIENADLDLYVRSAHRSRSFRITRPAGSDEDFLHWRPVPDGPFRVRRFVQFAASTSRSESERSFAIELRFAHRSEKWFFAALAGLALAVLILNGTWVRSRSRFAGRWVFRHRASLLVVSVALAATASMWNTGVDGDEGFTVGSARKVMTTGTLAIKSFTYPHLPAYLQVGATMLHGVLRSARGIAYHDPFSNQLYFDGRRVRSRPQSVFNPSGYPIIIFDTALPWIRRGYAVLGAFLILAVFMLARHVGNDRAAVLAALSVAVQPLLMRPQILPNVFGAALAITTVYVLLTRPSTAGWTFLKGCMAGVLTAWKYNPTFAPLLIGFVLLDCEPSKRWNRVLAGIAGLPVGFLAVYPSLPWYFREFLADTSIAAHYYAWGGHRFFTADAPWGAILHGAFIRRQIPGSYVVVMLAVLGTLWLLLQCREPTARTKTWVLLFPAIAMTWFLQAQMVQFGRNYTIPLAFVCVLSGLGGDVVLRAASFNRVLRWFATATILIALGNLVFLQWRRLEPYWNEPTARQLALSWVNQTAELGASVKLVEDVQRLEGVLPDQARFRVRWHAASGKHFDYIVVAEGKKKGTQDKAVESFSFTGRGVTGGEETYTVHRFARFAQEPRPSER